MKILFDYQAFEQQKYGGVSLYFFEIVSRLKQSNDTEYELPISYSSNEYLKEIPEIKDKIIGGSDFYKSFFGGYEFKGKHRLFKFRNKFFQRTYLIKPKYYK